MSAPTKVVANFSKAELACRIAETVMGVKRPDGATPQRALAALDAELRDAFAEAAEVAFRYISGQLAEAGMPMQVVRSQRRGLPQ